MDANVLILGIIVSSIGSGMIIYGKVKTEIWPIVIGLMLLVVPFIFSSLLGLSFVTVVLLVAAYLLREQ